jgi:XisI protein
MDDTVIRYRKVIRELIQNYAQYQPARGEVQIEVIIDEKNDHYELMYAGWNGPYRIHGSVLHVDIRDGKVWIQHDGTEEGIAEKLVSAGIPREHIVLAFKAPAIRPHTGFATA